MRQNSASRGLFATKTATSNPFWWLWAGGCVPVLLLVTVACSTQAEKPIAYAFQSTKEAGARVSSDGHARLVQIDVPAYYLVAEDHSVCEVDSARYVVARLSPRATCQWVQP